MSKNEPVEILKIARISDHKEEALLIVEIISAWNTIEDRLSQLLSVWTGTDPRQAHVFMAWIQSSQSRIEAVRAAGEYFLKQHAPDLIEELTETFALLTKRLRCRNKYAHARFQESNHGKLFLVNRRFEAPDPDSSEIVYTIGLQNELKLFDSVALLLDDILTKTFYLLPAERMRTLLEIWSQQAPHPEPNQG